MKPMLLFDGDCGFCTASASLIVRRMRPRADVVPYQDVDLTAYGITPEEASTAIQFIDAHGKVTAGGAAVRSTLAAGGRGWRVIAALLGVPGISWLLERAYRIVARNRYRLPGSTPACKLPDRQQFSRGETP